MNSNDNNNGKNGGNRDGLVLDGDFSGVGTELSPELVEEDRRLMAELESADSVVQEVVETQEPAQVATVSPNDVPLLVTRWNDPSEQDGGKVVTVGARGFVRELVDGAWLESAEAAKGGPQAGWSPATYRWGRRALHSMVYVTGLLLVGAAGLVIAADDLRRQIQNVAHAAWYGVSAGDPVPRWRVFFPFWRHLLPPDYQRFVDLVRQHLPLPPVDLRQLAGTVVQRPVVHEDKLGWTHLAVPLLDAQAALAGDENFNDPKKALRAAGVHPIGEVVPRAFDRIVRRAQGLEVPVPTPWPSVNEALNGGLWPGLHIVVGGTGTGKTQLGLQIALGGAQRGFPALYVALELSDDELTVRLAGVQSGQMWSELWTGQCLDRIQRVQAQVQDELAGLPLSVQIANPYSWTAKTLEDNIREFARLYRPLLRDEQGLMERPPLVVLDFLQIVGGEAQQSLREKIQTASYSARRAARDYDAAVLLLSSTARENYKKLEKGRHAKNEENALVEHNPREYIGLGKESGEVEYASDVVAALVGDHESRMDVDQNWNVHVALSKVRAGRAKWVSLAFDGNRIYERTVPTALVPPANPDAGFPADGGDASGKTADSTAPTEETKTTPRANDDAPSSRETDDRYNPDLDPLA